MAQYKYSQFLSQETSTAYDTLHVPGDNTPNSGIYRCEVCGREVCSNKDNPLPPQNHHQHPAGSGAIKWRLIVFAQG